MLGAARVPDNLSGAGPQRGLSSAELFPAVAVVVAGRDQGRLPRPREHRRRIRAHRALASFEMKLPSVVSLKSYVRPARHPAFTRFNVFLRDRFECQYCGCARGPDVRSSRPALARRAHDLGQCGDGLRRLQSSEGRTARPSHRHASAALSAQADDQRIAQQRPPVSAQLSARILGGLSLLGQRSGPLKNLRLQIFSDNRMARRHPALMPSLSSR